MLQTDNSQIDKVKKEELESEKDAEIKKNKKELFDQKKKTFTDKVIYYNKEMGFDVYYIKQFIKNYRANNIFRILEKVKNTFIIFHKNELHNDVEIPDDNFCILLMRLFDDLEVITKIKFNSVRIIKYTNNFARVDYHCDGHETLEENSPICGISFGAKRNINFRNIKNPKIKLKIELSHGSMYVMNYPTDTYWQHSIPKTKHTRGMRISLTFRVLNFITDEYPFYK
jgi:hypothetical protein